jgi:putative heme iron utilization protein
LALSWVKTDPLVEAAPGILTHMNADHTDAIILLAKSHARIETIEATLTSVDRLGFTLRLKTNEGVKNTRINFLHEVATAQDTPYRDGTAVQAGRLTARRWEYRPRQNPGMG